MTGAISNGLLEMIRFVTSRNSSVNELYFCRTSTEWQIFLCFCILLPLLVAWFILFLKYSTSTWMRDSPHAQPPTWKTRFFFPVIWKHRTFAFRLSLSCWTMGLLSTTISRPARNDLLASNPLSFVNIRKPYPTD